MIRALTVIMLTMILSTAAMAKFSFDNVKVEGIGLKFGLTDPEDVDSTLGLGLVMPLGTVDRQVHVGATLDYWSKEYSVAGSSLKLDISDFAIGLHGYYDFKPNDILKPFAGAGLAVHFMSADLENRTAIPFQNDYDETKIGLDIFGGVIYAFNQQWDYMAEAKFRLVSDINQLDLKVAAIYKF